VQSDRSFLAGMTIALLCLWSIQQCPCLFSQFSLGGCSRSIVFNHMLILSRCCYRVKQVLQYRGIVLRCKYDIIGGMKMKSKLPALMSNKGVDQKTVAAATGLSPTTVGKIYRSHFDRIDNHTVTQLCKYFDIKNLDQLLEIVWEDDDRIVL
jgi:DNA-binding Xre family transcriptional regulator